MLSDSKFVKFFSFFLTSLFFNVLLTNNFAQADETCLPSDSFLKVSEKFNKFYFDLENHQEAFNCAQYGAAFNDASSEGWLGYFYYYGIGTDSNLVKSYEYFQKASDKDHGYSSWYLGLIYTHGIQEIGLKVNLQKSLDYFKKSYEENYVYAREPLAQIYYFGIGTNKNYTESFKLLSNFSNSLSSFGKDLLAKHYLLGRGTSQDINKGVALLEESIEEGYFASSQTLNQLFGTNYLDKENRKPQSTFFYKYEREQYINFGYLGLEKEQRLLELSHDKKYLEVINYASEIVNSFIESNETAMTHEVCYAIQYIGFTEALTEGELYSQNEIFDLNELAYKNDCGDIAGANYAFHLLTNENKKDYKKAFTVLINDIKNTGGSGSPNFLAGMYYRGEEVQKNDLIAYILFKYKSQNNYETHQDNSYAADMANEIEKVLTPEQIEEADLYLTKIENDYTEILKLINYSDSSNKASQTLTAEILDSSPTENSQISDFQKNVLLTKSNIEKKDNLGVSDKSPPIIILDKEIKVEGLTANISLNISDDSNIAALFIDGVPVVIPPDNGGKVIVEQSVFVGSNNIELEIVAYDKWGLNTIERIVLNKIVETFKINYGDYYALIIGNNEYDYLPNLKTAVNDSRVISEILRSKYKFKDVIQLENATRKEILVSLYNLKNKLNFNDNLFIYYAGHGEIDRQLSEGYWQPVDSMPEMPTEWIDNNTITSILSTMKAKHILIVADSCYSGLLTRSGSPTLKNSFENREILLQRLTNKKSRLVFTSGGDEPVQDGGGGEHSIFAKSLIDTLLNNNKEITFTEITQQVIPFVISNSDQTPEFAPLHKSGHDGGDFIFVPSI